MHFRINRCNFVTGNNNKVREAESILGVELKQVDSDALYEIQTNDLSELILHKLNLAYDHWKSPVMVEDSALIFTAWNGLPGSLVKWFEKSVGCEGMIQMLDSFEDKSAIALCQVAIKDGDFEKSVAGQVCGRIAPAPRGSNGFGWDSIFIPESHERTYGEMEPEEKNSMSHRFRAFKALREFLES